jgi:hypothetical protein
LTGWPVVMVFFSACLPEFRESLAYAGSPTVP